jgi:hypothetical protein
MEQSTKVDSNPMRNVAKEQCAMQMVQSIQENFVKINEMDVGNTSPPMAISTKEDGKMVYFMDRESSFVSTGMSMKGNILVVVSMVMDGTPFLAESMTGNGFKGIALVKVG